MQIATGCHGRRPQSLPSQLGPVHVKIEPSHSENSRKTAAKQPQNSVAGVVAPPVAK